MPQAQQPVTTLSAMTSFSNAKAIATLVGHRLDIVYVIVYIHMVYEVDSGCDTMTIFRFCLIWLMTSSRFKRLHPGNQWLDLNGLNTGPYEFIWNTFPLMMMIQYMQCSEGFLDETYSDHPTKNGLV